ncbi:hypothetical protein ACC692_37820, partial [Rhizobium ruizarguesonis]
FSVGDSSFSFAGRTRPEALATQLQLMSAYTSDPAYRPEAFKRVQQAYLSGVEQRSGRRAFSGNDRETCFGKSGWQYWR